MALAPAINDITFVDADTHVVEPPDLWTSRVSSKWGDRIPRVRLNEETGEEVWWIGDTQLYAAGLACGSGWTEFPPDHPKTLAEADHRDWDPKRRLEIMDQYGCSSQILYPNIGLFTANQFLKSTMDPALAIECVRAYNDFLIDWQSVAPERYIPVMMVPFWDLEATKAEITRAAAAGHKGIVFPARMNDFGLPALEDTHWDPVWAQAQEMEFSINFHIGAGNIPMYGTKNTGKHLSYAWAGAMGFMLNTNHVTTLIYGGICQRFPNLNFISVESGIGWIPFLLESLDWQFHNCGIRQEHPEFDLLPSEYFARQIYGCFWFEGGAGRAAIDLLGADHFLFETDFPHPVGMIPGPNTIAVDPRAHLQQYFGDMDAEDLHKITRGNAERLYHLG